MPLDGNRLRRERVYDHKAPLSHLEADLAAIASFAFRLRASRKRFRWAGGVAICVGIVLLNAYLPAALALIVTGILLLIRVKSYPVAIVNNVPRCDLAKAACHMLAQDADPHAKAHLRLEFEPVPKILSEVKLPHRKNGKQKIMRYCWLTLETGLRDGCTFTQTVDDLVRERSFTNPRGKSKRKTRTRHILGLRLAYPSKVYGDLSPLTKLLRHEIKLPPSALLRSVIVTPKVIKLKALVRSRDDLTRGSSMLALGVYRCLNLARETHARSRKAGGGR